MLRKPFAILLLLTVAGFSPVGLLFAQEDQPNVEEVRYGQTLVDTITDNAFFDWWRINAAAGDEMLVEMQAADGLVPLIGLLSPDQDLVARSDLDEVAQPDGFATLRYRFEQEGLYTIVATRDGLDAGISTGTYRLSITRLGDPARFEQYAEVEFRCGAQLITTALAFTLNQPPNLSAPEGQPVEFYRVTVFGFEGFRPIIRAQSAIQAEPLDCTSDARALPGSQVILPGMAPVTVTEADEEHLAQLTLLNSSRQDFYGSLRITIGSLEGAAGLYLVVVEGLRLANRGDEGELRLNLGPLARETTLSLYMVGMQRLDPALQALNPEGDVIVECDDAGSRGCPDVPAFTGAGAILYPDDPVTLIGDRFDAGLILQPGSADELYLRLMSRERRTSGDFVLFFIGELPPR